MPRYDITQGRAHSRCPIKWFWDECLRACVRGLLGGLAPGSRARAARRRVQARLSRGGGGGGDAPGGSPVPGRPPPAPRARARRGRQDRREPPAGGTGHAQTASRSRRERASFLAPPASATYLGARRPRMLQVRPWRDPRGAGAGRGARGGGAGGAIGAAPPPLSPGARRTRGRADGQPRGPGATSRRGGGAPAGRGHLAGPGGREQAGRVGLAPGGRWRRRAWACAPTRTGADTGGGARAAGGTHRRALRRRARPGPRWPRGRPARGEGASPARRPDLPSSPGESASRLSKMAFPGPGMHSGAADTPSPLRRRYGMVDPVPAERPLPWGSACERAAQPAPRKFPRSATQTSLRSCTWP